MILSLFVGNRAAELGLAAQYFEVVLLMTLLALQLVPRGRSSQSPNKLRCAKKTAIPLLWF